MSDAKAVVIGLAAGLGVFVAGNLVGAGVYKNLADPVTPPPIVKTVEATPTPSETPSATPTKTEEPEEKTDAKYGKAYVYSNGLRVTVTKPKKYPKDPAVTMKDDCYWLFTVIVKNISNTTFPRTGDFYSEVNASAGHMQPAEGTGIPSVSIKPGKTLTYTEVYGTSCHLPVYGLAMSPLWEVDPVITWG